MGYTFLACWVKKEVGVATKRWLFEGDVNNTGHLLLGGDYSRRAAFDWWNTV